MRSSMHTVRVTPRNPAHRTTHLADRGAELAERCDQLRARDDRQPLIHAGSGSLRRTMPISRGCPSSRSPSMYSVSASRALSVASSRLSP